MMHKSQLKIITLMTGFVVQGLQIVSLLIAYIALICKSF